MAIALNTAHSSGSIFHPQTLAYTANASDTRILGVAASSVNPGQAPTPVTYNSVAMTLVGSIIDASTFLRLYLYYLDNPGNSLGWGSALSLSEGYTANGTAYAVGAVSMAGVDLTRAPVIGTGTAVNPTTAPVNALTGGGANDIYLAALWCASATITANGAPQSSLTQTLAVNGSTSLDLSLILGSSAGNFGWTVANSNTVALGVTIFAPAASGSGAMTGPMTMGVTHPIDQSVTGLPI